MADPFRERLRTLAITTRHGHSYKLLVAEGEGRDVLHAWYTMEPLTGPYIRLINTKHSVHLVDLAEVVVMELLMDEEISRDEVIEYVLNN